VETIRPRFRKRNDGAQHQSILLVEPIAGHVRDIVDAGLHARADDCRKRASVTRTSFGQKEPADCRQFGESAPWSGRKRAWRTDLVDAPATAGAEGAQQRAPGRSS
jgi:hypothetical protein